MLADVDLALRALFEARMTTLGAGTPSGVKTGQIGIQPPDDDWISDVKGFTPPIGLNVYLADLRENRKLRSNERVENSTNGVAYRHPAPMRIDCRYLISAWSGSTDRKEKTVTEHGVLTEALTVLVEERTISAAGIDLPTSIAPPDGFPKLAEFWGTMGHGHRWKPAIELVVTVPIQESTELAGPEVTTRFTEYRQGNDPASGELLIQIAGFVDDHEFTPPIRVIRAWVQLEDAAGSPLLATRTDANGEFTFLGLKPGPYQLRVRADGRAEPPVTPIVVPEPSGAYDLHFT